MPFGDALYHLSDERQKFATRPNYGNSLEFAEKNNLFENTAGGFLMGLRRDPLVRPLVDAVGSTMGFGSDQLDELEFQLSNSTAASAAAFVGEWSPILLGGMGAFSLGRKLATKGLVKMVAASNLKPSSPFTQAAGKLVQELGAGPARPAATVIARATQAVGGSFGIGAYEGAREYATSKDVPESLRHAATAAMITAGFETAFFGLGVAIPSVRRRIFDVNPALPGRRGEPSIEERATVGKALATNEIKGIGSRLAKLDDDLSVALQRADQQLGLENAVTYTSKLTELEEVVRKLRPVDRALADVVEETTKQRQQLYTHLQATLPLRDEEIPFWVYTHATPLNPSGLQATIYEQAAKRMWTPEAFEGAFGRAGAVLFRKWKQVDADRVAGHSVNAQIGGKALRTVNRALGLRHRGEKWKKMHEAWEAPGTDGPTGLRQYLSTIGIRGQKAERTVKAWESMSDQLRSLHLEAKQMGGEFSLDFAEAGVGDYWPQLMIRRSHEDILNIMMKHGRHSSAQGRRLLERAGVIAPDETLTEASANTILQGVREGPAKFASVDFQRSIPGTLKEKLEAIGPIFEEDPIIAYLRSANAMVDRIAIAKQFGWNSELAPVMKNAIAAEAGGGARRIVNTFVDMAAGHRYWDQAHEKLADFFISGQISSKLALAVIPNASQSINTVLWGGWKANYKGFRDFVRTHGLVSINKDDATAVAVAMGESVPGALTNALHEAGLRATKSHVPGLDRLTNLSSKVAHHTLQWTGFSGFERFNRVYGGHVVQHVVYDTVAKGRRGLLKGINLDRARRRMHQLGLNLDDIVRQGDDFFNSPVGQRQLKEAIFRGSQLTQFTPGDLRRPVWWNTPTGRIMMQFKNFALGQYRFLRDAVLEEAARGNYVPLAHFMSIYPVAGEVVKGAQDLARLRPSKRPQNQLERFRDNVLAVGGLGIATDFVKAAQFGNLEGLFLGPTISDAFQFGELMMRQDLEGMTKHIARQPVFQAITSSVTVGLWAGDEMDRYLDQLGNAAETGATTADELFVHQALEKNR